MKDFRARNIEANIERTPPKTPYTQEFSEDAFRGSKDMSRIKNHFNPNKQYADGQKDETLTKEELPVNKEFNK